MFVVEGVDILSTASRTNPRSATRMRQPNKVSTPTDTTLKVDNDATSIFLLSILHSRVVIHHLFNHNNHHPSNSKCACYNTSGTAKNASRAASVRPSSASCIFPD
jgi:hypothetical protein